MKDQNSIDTIAAITIASYTKRLERENTRKQISQAQTVYGLIAAIVYARSEMVEVGAVTAVHYLLHGTTLVSSHEFQSLHLGRHLNDLKETESNVRIILLLDSMSQQTINDDHWNKKTKPSMITRRIIVYPGIFKRILTKNENCMRLHPDKSILVNENCKKLQI